jgi:replicative DNA helicase
LAYFESARTQAQLQRVYEKGRTQSEPHWNFGYPLLTQAFPNLECGLTILAASENVGKSQFSLNLGYNVLRNDPNAYWMDFSLDDDEGQRLSYLLARAGEIPISWITRAGALSETEQQQRHDAFFNFNRQYNARYHLISEGETEGEGLRFSAEWITTTVEAARRELDQRDQGRWEQENTPVSGRIPSKLLITIDGFHDIDLETRSQDENDRQRRKSQMLKRSAKQLNCLYLMTAQTRQDSRARGLTADVVRGDTGVIYDAKVVIRLYCDLNLNREKAELFWHDNNGERLPILECDVLKNKVGSYKGTIFFHYIPWRCHLHEADIENQAWYHDLAFSPRER